MTKDEILDELAAQIGGIREFCGATFEMLEEYWAMADARLSAFASEKMWAVAIEVVGYQDGAEEYELRVWLFGNCLNAQSGDFDFQRLLFTVPHAWNKEIEPNQVWGIARDGFALCWRGQRHDFAPSLEELQRAGVELSRQEVESDELSSQQMLRFVCEKMDHPFFLSEDALRDLLDARALPFEWKYDEKTQRSWIENELGKFDDDQPPIPSVALKLVLQTREWTHPKQGLADRSAGEWEISPHQAFEALAHTLATRDLEVWQAQDAAKFNSHWRNWVETEADKERAQAEFMAAAKAAFRAWVMEIPLGERAEFLEQTRPTIERAPSFLNWGSSMSMTRDGKCVQVFHELLDEIDAMRAEAQAFFSPSEIT